MMMMGEGTTSPSERVKPAVGVKDEMATIGRAASAEMILTNLRRMRRAQVQYCD
jgi:hypothetical protein